MMLKSLPLLFSFAVMLCAATPGQAQDAAAGEKVYKKCKACHQVGPDAKHRTGPLLNGVVDRAAASAEGYKYKKSIVAAADLGLVWDEAQLMQYLTNPTQYLRAYLDDPKAKSAMTFKLKDEQDQRDVIAFLAAQSGDAVAKEDTVETTAKAEPQLSADEVVAAQVFTEEFLADPVNFEAGKEMWFAQCTHCHGYKAYPGKAPKLKPGKYTPEFVFKRVYKGFKKMPEWHETFSVDEIRQIVAYVKAPGFSP